MKKVIKNILLFIILLLAFILIFSINWIYNTYGNISLEEIMFQIRVPNTGANTDYYFSYAKNALSFIIICTIVSFILINILIKKRKKVYPKRMKEKEHKIGTSLVIYKKKLDTVYLKKLSVSFLILIISLVYSINKTDLITYLNYQLSESTLIENEFINTSNTNIEFPEEKRNLIYIYLESMEASFYSKENDGAYNQSLIEDLEELAEENIAFSNSNKLKGLYSLPGSTWTTGAMTAQTTGLPLKIPIDGNAYGEYATFLPGATGLR